MIGRVRGVWKVGVARLANVSVSGATARATHPTSSWKISRAAGAHCEWTYRVNH